MSETRVGRLSKFLQWFAVVRSQYFHQTGNSPASTGPFYCSFGPLSEQ